MSILTTLRDRILHAIFPCYHAWHALNSRKVYIDEPIPESELVYRRYCRREERICVRCGAQATIDEDQANVVIAPGEPPRSGYSPDD